MTILAVAAKAILLVVAAIVAFAAIAMFVGFEPAAAGDITACKTEPKPVCLFTIF